MGSSLTCNRVVDWGNSELGNLSSFAIVSAISFYKLMLVFILFTTLASSMGNPSHELGVVFGFKVQPSGLLMSCNGF